MTIEARLKAVEEALAQRQAEDREREKAVPYVFRRPPPRGSGANLGLVTDLRQMLPWNRPKRGNLR